MQPYLTFHCQNQDISLIFDYSHTNLIEIIKAYPEFGKYIGYKPVSEGHINDTYIVEYEMEDGSVSRYLLQRINVNVFKKPVELMENVMGSPAFYIKKSRRLAEIQCVKH
mgnify:CR=1 FL=1